MAEVMEDIPADDNTLDRRRDRSRSKSKSKSSSPPLDRDLDRDRDRDREPITATSSPPPPQPPPPPPPPRRSLERRRDRDSRDRDSRDRDFDRNPRGGGGGGGGRNDYYDRSNFRERDYKRGRASHSPPPHPHPPHHHHHPFPPYRDRRGGGGGGGGGYSPPPHRNRSPPFHQPYKRSRRDDYDGGRRGGSPRGGFNGHADRRYGYDRQVGYERDMGGRPGYPDERHHGRFAGRSGGYRDWGPGRGGFADTFGAGNNQREGLKSYKQFIQELEDDILPAEAERRYQEYKAGYIEAQKRAYFNAHKNEEWLKDKYHPTNLISVIERRDELARKSAKDFLLDLQSGTLDIGPGVTPASANKSGQSSEPNSDEEADESGKRRRHGRGSTKETDLLSAAPKAHQVSSDPRRIQIDVEQAQALVRKLDSEKGIEDNILSRSDNDRGSRDKSHGSSGPVIIIRGLTSVKGLEGTELLDTLLTYLWRIHGVDYYGVIETNEAKGLRHVRLDGKASDATGNGEEWETKLDSHWQDRLKGRDPLEVMAAKEKIDAAAAEALDPYVRKIRDEKYGWKYGCGAKGCTKLFHAAEFVHKHLKLKHPDLAVDLTTKVREDLYFKNYMNDVNAPGGTPVMLPSMPKEKPLRRGPGLDGRLKDDRGNRRDRDGRANGGERFDMSDNPQSGDFQSNNDGAGGGNPDEEMFDTFGGQGIPVASFPSDMAPPPVLMPVPGAGPLGPFVPAPPEVAMRMMREQGGPTPFEGGRNGRSGPAISGASPIIALPPGFRQDPRRLRSYNDLDAPEDEVTVIDYRSL
ncbi:serrate RNA effector molecule-like isoform X2 [Lycium ferocissimum]|uniref:serrate RNA effector molecule-like isoform X2 n=1 Tax=Lycium ferocissimum TaxID=112874 RepID=UPI0028160100|nr:serrate RNA effector molecule-like isoform X2 [Lycium ferocissimum]